jgi:enolase-phosphatase E1
VLFPYARARLADYVGAHPDRVAPVLAQVRAHLDAPDLTAQQCIAHLLAWHDEDRKIGPLKLLQGMIWADGYADGTLRGHVYPDAAAGLRRWHAQGLRLAVYSSGSVAAQKLLFAHSDQGDLSALFSGWFDTAVGGKREVASYRAIAAALGLAAQDILFLSDVVEELDAARAAGLRTLLLARDGLPAASTHPVATGFERLIP